LSEECNGRYAFAKELYDAHPDVTKITQKFNRWHHHVDYRPFRNNKLSRVQDLILKNEVNNYGMELKPL
jgi:hypothetical protein